MPEHLRALVVILFLAALTYAFARGPAVAVAVAPRDFRRRRNVWFAVTLIAFLANNFWLYIMTAGALVALASAVERNRIALFFALMFAVPAVSVRIGGLGFLEHLFAINHVRLLSLAVLLPAFLQLAARPHAIPFGRIWPDRFLAAYLAVAFFVMLATTTFTNVLRHGVFYAFIDVFLPYYVASRALRTVEDFRDALMTFVVACLVLSAMALFEMTRHWMLYAALVGAMDVRWDYGQYLPRGNVALRAQATTGQPIALGFVVAVALGLMLYVRTLIPGRLRRRLVAGLLVGGLVASISRGPWLGAAVMPLALLATGRGPWRLLGRLTLLGVVALPAIALLPGVGSLVSFLPFVGSVDAENVTYRQRLLESAMEEVWKSPWFGGIDIYAAESAQGLRQHYGSFIDVVNSYVGILLGSGFVGLGLFLGVFVSTLHLLYRITQGASGGSPEFRLLGRTLFATLVGILVVIFTVSSITVIPTVYWTVTGAAVGYCLAHLGQPARVRGGALDAGRDTALGRAA